MAGLNNLETTVFCNTMNEIAIAVYYLISQLGKKMCFRLFCCKRRQLFDWNMSFQFLVE